MDRKEGHPMGKVETSRGVRFTEIGSDAGRNTAPRNEYSDVAEGNNADFPTSEL